jgi:hypothetical protein
MAPFTHRLWTLASSHGWPVNRRRLDWDVALLQPW